jgi:hypothetical protein
MTDKQRLEVYAQKMYRTGRIRGVSHAEILGFISDRYKVNSSGKLTKDQINAIRTVLRALPVVPKEQRPPAVHRTEEERA